MCKLYLLNVTHNSDIDMIIDFGHYNKIYYDIDLDCYIISGDDFIPIIQFFIIGFNLRNLSKDKSSAIRLLITCMHVPSDVVIILRVLVL